MSQVRDHGEFRPRRGRPPVNERVIAAFAERLNIAVDANPNIPPKHHGQLTWFLDQFQKKFGAAISQETIRKWLGGIKFMPSPDNMRRLAELLQVDEAWLAHGEPGEAKAVRGNARSATALAAANLVAGMIALDGGSVAFPAESDGDRSGIHLHAIIKGAQYSIRIIVGERENGYLRFRRVVPAAANVMTIALVRREGFHFDVLEITPETIEQHRALTRGAYDLVLPAAEVNWITSFAERL